MQNPITTERAASAQNPLPPVPTTKILAISHFIGTPMTPAQRAQIMPHEVHETVNAYLAGKIDQSLRRTGNGFAARNFPFLLVSRFLPASKVCLWCGSQHCPEHFNEGTYAVVTDCNSDLRDRFPLCEQLKGSKQPRLLSPTAK